QARGLVDRPFLVDRERRRLGDGEPLRVADLELDVAGGEDGVLVALLALDDLASDADDVLGAQTLGDVEARARVEDELDEAAAVAQVDEDQPAVVAAAVHPAGDADVAAGVTEREVAGPAVAEAVGARGLDHRPGPRRTSRTS